MQHQCSDSASMTQVSCTLATAPQWGSAMDVVGVWSGRHACALQSALRMTNEGFANHLGVGVRTVATWHADPDIVPRTELQQVLDSAYEQASDAVRQRFIRLSSAKPAEDGPPSSTGPEPQTLRVAIAVVIRDGEVLLVCRRSDDSAGLTWQFPAGVVKPGARPEVATVRETLSETGVHCSVRLHLGSRLHPITGVMCEYFLCDYLAGDAENKDVLENVDAMWVPQNALTRFIPADRLYPPILTALGEQT